MGFSNLFNNLFLISSISHILSCHPSPPVAKVPISSSNGCQRGAPCGAVWGAHPPQRTSGMGRMHYLPVRAQGRGGGAAAHQLPPCVGCLDHWMWNKQHGCPLCRSPLLPNEMYGAFQGEFMWASAGIPDSYIYKATWAHYAHITARAKDC